MDETLLKLIETQINKELYSAYAYLGISKFYKLKGYSGIGAWFVAQAKEEMEHAEKFVDYLSDNKCEFDLLPIPKPDYNFTNVRAPLDWQISHEKYVTSLIKGIYQTAVNVGDDKTKDFLQWFLDEQAEEEETAQKLLDEFDNFIMQGEPGLRNFDMEMLYRR